jgi:hypothetical protein
VAWCSFPSRCYGGQSIGAYFSDNTQSRQHQSGIRADRKLSISKQEVSVTMRKLIFRNDSLIFL